MPPETPDVNFESEDDFDPQDTAEALDESMTVGGDGDGAPTRRLAEIDDRRTFEELPEVMDLTQLMGDRDDDEELALDADEFDEDAFDDDDLEDDRELDYRAASEEREDDIDGLGGEPGTTSSEDALDLSPDEIEGLDELGDAELVEGGEDDFTDFQARDVSDEDLQRMGYTDRDGRAIPDGR